MKNDGFDNIITLTDENGNRVDFEFLDHVEYKGGEYVVLFPVGEEENFDVVILKIEAGDSVDENNYVGIDDEETLMAVFEIFKERFESEFDVIE
ncbi:MAG: DUF1292 domain-containing protein [Clostridia bacterium]|nr:DUF1292 domain-containing protein [Clostridia bacterium]